MVKLLVVPDNRPFWTRMKVYFSGLMFQWFVKLATRRKYIKPVERRLEVKIDTGETGVCRALVYLAKEGLSGSRGVVLHIHGGGWTICYPEMETTLCQEYVDKLGCVVVAPEYWKAPLYPCPFALKQCYAVTQWIASGGLAQNLPDGMTIDSSRIAVSGVSAGGNLATALTTLAVEKPITGSKIVAQALMYPITDLSQTREEKIAKLQVADKNRPPGVEAGMWRIFEDGYIAPPANVKDPLVSPLFASDAVIQKIPPTTIVTAEYDFLSPEAEAYAKRLRNAGIHVSETRFMSLSHGFDLAPARNEEEKRIAQEATVEAYRMLVDGIRNWIQS